ncbi:MAG: transglycosylase SLT domain-containing protein [Cardiobacteriaceae bacterium]|nr:transglycosylase SLT domain-containing protein [Cardiobacteriaceae bacterium]
MKKRWLAMLMASALPAFGQWHELREAEKAIEAGAPLAQYQHYAQHPLYPYLQYQYYLQNFMQVEDKALISFLTQHQTSPFARRLAESVYPHWIARKNYAAIVQTFDAFNESQNAQCAYREALYFTGKQNEALHDVQSLWEKDLPPACLTLHQIAPADEKSEAKRFGVSIRKSVNAGQSALAGLSEEGKQQAQVWLSVVRKQLPESALWDLSSVWRSAALSHRIYQLSGKNWEEGLTLAQSALARQALLPQDKGAALSRLLRKLAQNDYPQSVLWFGEIPAGEHEDALIEDVVAYLQRNHRWQEIPKLLAHLNEETRSQAQWQYWLGKAYEKQGQSALSQQHYQQAAKKRDIYGFFAAEKLGLPYQFEDNSVKTRQAKYRAVIAKPAVYRVKLLMQYGDTGRAYQEWTALSKTLNEEQNRQLAFYGSELGWHQLVIPSLAQAKVWDALAQRFPMPYQKRIEHYAHKYQLSPSTVLAIIRKESIFRTDIASPAGAIGIMQIMPKTAASTAKAAGIPYAGKHQLTDLETNLDIGSLYLKQRLEEFGHLAYAAAAYNAGPSRVYQWRERFPHLPLDEWIIQIPFDETRDYVKSVLEYEKIYQYRRNEPQTPIQHSGISAW